MEKNWREFWTSCLNLSNWQKQFEKTWRKTERKRVCIFCWISQTGRNSWKKHVQDLKERELHFVLEPHTGRNSLQKHGEELKERVCILCLNLTLAEMVRRNMEKNWKVESCWPWYGCWFQQQRHWFFSQVLRVSWKRRISLKDLSFKLELYRLIIMVGKLAGFCKMMSLINWCWWWESLQGFIRWWAW